MLYYLQTIPGLGQLAWQESEQRLTGSEQQNDLRLQTIRLVPRRDDIVLLRYSGNARTLLRLRVSEDVFAVAVRAFNIAADERGLRQIYAATRESRFVEGALAVWSRVTGTRHKSNTFRIVTREVGNHRFRRREIGRAVADAVKAVWPGRWREVDEGADVEIWVTLLNHELLCGLRLSGPEMRQRDKVRHMPASLRPALAAAMVQLTNPAPDDVFLDPMAGAGTILLERSAAGPVRKIYGGDNDAEMVAALRANVRSLLGTGACERWDARTLPLPDASVDKIAVNMPFGKQVAVDIDLPVLYRDVLAEMQRVLCARGRFVALVGDARMLETARARAAPQFRLDTKHRVAVLGMTATICVYTHHDSGTKSFGRASNT